MEACVERRLKWVGGVAGRPVREAATRKHRAELGEHQTETPHKGDNPTGAEMERGWWLSASKRSRE